jgi:serine/threonine protein phosphatase PrpC
MDRINRFFKGKEKLPPDQASTAPLDPRSIMGLLVDDFRMHMTVGAAHAIAEKHGRNEDSLIVLNGTAVSSDGLPDFGLFCVADGQVGGENPARASAVSVRSIAKSITQEAILDLLAPEPVSLTESVEDMVRLAVEKANREVRANVDGSSTTLTTALVLGNRATIGHVGDTRAYLILPERITPLTRDHSLVRQLVDTGTISEEEAAVHPQKDSLWNALGKAIDVKVDVSTHEIPASGYLLICSDGIWSKVDDQVLWQIILEADDPQIGSEAVIGAASKGGREDDMSAIVVRFPKGDA